MIADFFQRLKLLFEWIRFTPFCELMNHFTSPISATVTVGWNSSCSSVNQPLNLSPTVSCCFLPISPRRSRIIAGVDANSIQMSRGYMVQNCITWLGNCRKLPSDMIWSWLCWDDFTTDRTFAWKLRNCGDFSLHANLFTPRPKREKWDSMIGNLSKVLNLLRAIPWTGISLLHDVWKAL